MVKQRDGSSALSFVIIHYPFAATTVPRLGSLSEGAVSEAD